MNDSAGAGARYRPTRLLLALVAGGTLWAGAAVLGPASGATQSYTSANAPLLDAAGGKAIGTLAPGAALVVEGTSGSATHVQLHGFAIPGAPAVVYAGADNKKIVALSGFSGRASSGAAQTVGGTTYAPVTIDGWVASSALVGDVQTVWKAGAALYQQKCSSCHALPAVGSYSAAQWPAIMKTQQDNANLDPSEAALITTYLQVQSGH